MKILIAYYSRTSNIKELTLAIAKEFENRGHIGRFRMGCIFRNRLGRFFGGLV
ncbi:MAG: hypothetical protein AAB623_02630 [Patescibacteria group bacterium]